MSGRFSTPASCTDTTSLKTPSNRTPKRSDNHSASQPKSSTVKSTSSIRPPSLMNRSARSSTSSKRKPPSPPATSDCHPSACSSCTWCAVIHACLMRPTTSPESGNLVTAQNWLGHKDISTTAAYVAIDPETKRRAFETFCAPDAAVPPDRWKQPATLQLLRSLAMGV